MLEKNRNYLTTFTGEPYQPVRLAYHVYQPAVLQEIFAGLSCLKFSEREQVWEWHLENPDAAQSDLTAKAVLDSAALDSPVKKSVIILGKFNLIGEHQLYLYTASIQRAYIAVSFFAKYLPREVAVLSYADFSNRLSISTGILRDETSLRQINMLFKEEVLQEQLSEREHKFHDMQYNISSSTATIDPFENLLSFADTESRIAVPEIERYLFDLDHPAQPADNIIVLMFLNTLMTRLAAAIYQWQENKTCSFQQVLTYLNNLSNQSISKE